MRPDTYRSLDRSSVASACSVLPRTIRTVSDLWGGILGRSCTIDARAACDDQPVTIGHLALLAHDLVIDPDTNSIVGNPAHGSEWILEI